VIGIGAGVVDRLMELGLPARGINVSESPAMKEQYPTCAPSCGSPAATGSRRRTVNLAGDDKLVPS
jgi:hypothetical protein